METVSSRDGAKQFSIYAHEAAEDSTDNMWVAHSVKKHLKPKRDALVDLNKMSPRNFASLVPTEALKNVLRDNAKADRLKKMMEFADDD